MACSTAQALFQTEDRPAPGSVGVLAPAPDLPAGFPETVDSPLAWTGGQYAGSSDYVLALTEEDLEELHDAADSFQALGLDGDLVSRDNFPLPNLGPRLDLVRHDVYQGRGFGVVRGLDPRKYNVETLSILFLGIQSYIANRRGRQDPNGNMLVHVVADNSSEVKANHHRHSTSAISFHNEEAGDIVGWLTRSTAASGGRCIISSAYTVYNVLAAGRPDLVRTLARSDWPFAWPKFECRPVYHFHEGRLMMNFGRTPLLGSAAHERPAHLPTLTPRQLEALDAVEEIAKATQLEIATRAGDMHFINNFAVMHRREGFVDGQGPEERRHLVRVRLRDDEMGWPLPPSLKDEWTEAFGPVGSRVWHLEPMPDGFFVLRTQPN